MKKHFSRLVLSALFICCLILQNAVYSAPTIIFTIGGHDREFVEGKTPEIVQNEVRQELAKIDDSIRNTLQQANIHIRVVYQDGTQVKADVYQYEAGKLSSEPTITEESVLANEDLPWFVVFLNNEDDFSYHNSLTFNRLTSDEFRESLKTHVLPIETSSFKQMQEFVPNVQRAMCPVFWDKLMINGIAAIATFVVSATITVGVAYWDIGGAERRANKGMRLSASPSNQVELNFHNNDGENYIYEKSDCQHGVVADKGNVLTGPSAQYDSKTNYLLANAYTTPVVLAAKGGFGPDCVIYYKGEKSKKEKALRVQQNYSKFGKAGQLHAQWLYTGAKAGKIKVIQGKASSVNPLNQLNPIKQASAILHPLAKPANTADSIGKAGEVKIELGTPNTELIKNANSADLTAPTVKAQALQ